MHSSSGAYLDPCLPNECTEQGTHKGKPYSFLGTGEYLKCQQLIVPLLNLTKPCPKKPCSFNAVYQPRIDYENVEFYGFSEYWYSMHDVLRIGGQYSATDMKGAVEVKFSCTYLFNSCFGPMLDVRRDCWNLKILLEPEHFASFCENNDLRY